MDVDHKFLSLTRKGIAYSVGDRMAASTFWNANYLHVGRMFSEYQCYDDGIVQHSPASPIQITHMVDFLTSYAKFLLDNPSKINGLLESWYWPESMDVHMLEFAYLVKYDSKKERWYSLQERKVTSSKSKRNDRRYELVPEWAKGTIESAFRILSQSYYEGLHRFALYVDLREYAFNKFSWYPRINGFGLNDESIDFDALLQGFDIIVNLLKAEVCMKRAELLFHVQEERWTKSKLEEAV